MKCGTPKNVFVVAGEASGDLHGANLIKALRTLSKEPLEIHGVGGDLIRETGAIDFLDLAHFHVTGISQAILKIPQYKAAAKTILANIASCRPDVVVLIDNPGFNLYLAKKIHAMRIPIAYYIAPQLWAWKKNRIFKIKKTVSKMLVVFDFEKKLYESHGVPVDFVGHPLKDILESKSSRSAPKPIITLMPGSRKHEVSTLLPIMLKACALLKDKKMGFMFRLIEAPTLPQDFYDPFLKSLSFSVQRVRENTYKSIQESLLVLVCSGTATLECAILGTPMIITNRASLLTYLAAKALIRVPYLGLPNLILNREAMPELMQFKVTPEKLAAATLKISTNSAVYRKMQNDLDEVSQRIGVGGASKNAAKSILSLICPG